MKKLFIILLGGCMLLSCDLIKQKKSSDSDSEDDEKTEQKADGLKSSGNAKKPKPTAKFETKELSYSYDEGKINVSISVDYPIRGNDVLCNAVREFISEELGGTYRHSLDEGKEVVDYYGNEIKTSLTDEMTREMQYVDNEDNINGFYRKVTIRKVYETERLVTFTCEGEVYMNGAHGSESLYGITFRKTDGRRLDWSMMHNTYNDVMHKIVKEGLRKYFMGYSQTSSMNDEELKEYIVSGDDVNYLPLPHHHPYVTKDGLAFVYQPYEISFYSAGMPSFNVPLNDIKHFLCSTAMDMLGM